jgi:hypothetical protein
MRLRWQRPRPGAGPGFVRGPAAALLALILAVAPAAPGGQAVALADSNWITGPLTLGESVEQWNAPGKPVPAAPPVSSVASAATAPLQIQARCSQSFRAPESPEEQQVVAAGWTLIGGASAGWDVRVVRGAINLDERCNPVLYQDFVFAGGAFAGTVSPAWLTPGEDGDLWNMGLASPNHVVTEFAQYYPETPECCPVGRAALDLQLQRPDGPVVVAPGRAASLPAPPATAYAGDAAAATADGGGSWLNAAPGAWNQLGATLPAPPVDPAPPPSGAAEAFPAACSGLLRAPQTDADATVTGAGWSLLGGYVGGWGVTIVHGVTGADAQCRPQGYQDFVFVDGAYAGTVAPQPMYGGADGALVSISIEQSDRLTAVFQRYTPNDPPGSPAGRTRLDLGIARSASGPLVTPLGPPAP